jgi:hypothetical protein
MRKFYRQEARRILAGQKKLSTILMTRLDGQGALVSRKNVDRELNGEKSSGVRASEVVHCGKAEEGSG